MKQKTKPKKEVGLSVKIDPVIYENLKTYCKDRGLKIGHLASKAIEEKLNSLA
jgi:hypothetical protein